MSNQIWYGDLRITPWYLRMLGYPPLRSLQYVETSGGTAKYVSYFAVRVRMDNVVELRKMERKKRCWMEKTYRCDGTEAT